MTYLISLIIALWIIAAIIQLYYWLVVAWPLAGHRTKTRPTSDPVSVIICTNRLTSHLKSLLTDILNQDYPEFELVVVNDGPDNDVRMLLNTFIPHHHNIKVIAFDTSAKQTGGKKELLAAGIAQAKHDWLLLTDSDCTVQPGWIQSMMNCASRKKRIVLGYGPLSYESGLVNAMSRFDTAMIALQYMSFTLKGWTYMGVGRNLLYHKNIYEKVGGFQGHIDLASGDDDLFVQSAATRDNVAVNMDPQSFVHSSAKSTWRDLINQKRRHVSTSGRYSWVLKVRIGLVGLSFIIMWLGGMLILTLLSAVPMALFALAASAQWIIYFLIAQRFESGDENNQANKRFGYIYPLWAVLYAVFLTFVGIIALFGRPPKSWNPS